ncbi:MAG: hypothetical protein J0M17_04515 [Planctomycetes bacterium]|nr:hypothetical protein [Planctomycetota bacterium]
MSRIESLTSALRIFTIGMTIGSVMLTGCGREADKHATKDGEHRPGDGHAAGEAGHEHPSEGPHKGHLIELGKEEYHAELLHDDSAHRITVYLLDGAGKKAVAIPEKELTVNAIAEGKPAQFKLLATPQKDDPSGSASKFELVDHALCEALDDPNSKGRLTVTIAGKQYSGDMAHDEHDDHK